MGSGAEDGDLVVVQTGKGEVVEATGSDPIGAVEGRHVGSSIWQVCADDGFDAIVSEQEIPDDSVGLFSSGEEIFGGRCDF